MPLRDPVDIWRAAKALVDRYGTEGPIHAAQRIDELAEAGDRDGREVWCLVLAAVEELLRIERPAGQTQH